MITPQLRKMIADREAQEAKMRAEEEGARSRTQRIMAAIDAANLEERGPTQWSSGSLAKIGYCVIATSGTRDCEKRAVEFVRDWIAA